MAALANVVFLVIVGLYRILESLHSMGEGEELMSEGNSMNSKVILSNFIRTFGVVKIMIDTSFLIFFSDYLIHPSLQIKLQLRKKYKAWKNFEELSLKDIKDNSELIKNWSNHFENMNALMMNVLCDLFSNIFFLSTFDYTHVEYYEKINLIVCFLNMILTGFVIFPLFDSITQILMQGTPKILTCFCQELQKTVSFYDGVLATQQMKLWMIGQNEIKCYLKLLVECNMKKADLRNQIDILISTTGINVELLLDTSLST
jgi:Co/Zn/Cd efflux system component